MVAACGEGPGANESANAVIDPPAQCSPDRPDCSLSEDFPGGSDLNASNSAGIRFSNESNSLVVDRVSALPDSDGDGVPDDADDCPGPGWRIPCDNDPTNDGLYETVFYDPSGAAEVVRVSPAFTVADIPQIDVYFLIDATPTLDWEIGRLQAEITTIIDDVRATFEDTFGDVRFGVGLYREYPYDPVAMPHSQSPYHHILDLTDDYALVETAIDTLNIVANLSSASAATQALYSIASGMGLGDTVPNRGSCPDGPDADIGYPCFRPDVLHVVMNITDAQVYNGPTGLPYPPFAPGVGDGVMTLPPVEMFPTLFEADSAATALDLGDLSSTSLTLMGMSTLLTNRVNTAIAPGCAPLIAPPDPPGADMDGLDVVVRFDSAVAGSAFANNTHWPGANVALFDDALLDPLNPLAALACDNGTNPNAVGNWGYIEWPMPLVTSQGYYLVADGIIPAADPGEPEDVANGAFSISIVHDGDPANSTWQTEDAPVSWDEKVLPALLASDIRVASVVTLQDPMIMPSPGSADARLSAAATDARTKFGGQWVTDLTTATPVELGPAIVDTIAFAKTDSVYDIALTDVDNDGTTIDERDFVTLIRHQNCAQGDPLNCGSGVANECRRCDVGAFLEYEVVFANTTVSPTGASQVFDFEIEVRADDAVEVERIPVRVMVPDAAAHDFDDLPGSSFYRNVYDSTARCITPPEHPKWGDLTWTGSTPGASTIEFQIRTAATVTELQTAIPAVVVIPTDTNSNTLNLTNELIADGQPWGLPYIQITAVLNATNSPPATPTLEGWTFEFVCEAAE
jgi:hypothetical protein